MTAAFDIIIPTWNRRYLLVESVASALAQTTRGVRVAVVDNGSTDGTLDAIRERFGVRVELHPFREHVPYQRNLNRCVSLLRAEHGLILHDDDLVDPDYVSTMLGLFARAPDAALVVASARPLRSPDSPFRRVAIRPPFVWYHRLGEAHADGVLVLEPGTFAAGLLRHLRMCPYWPSVSVRREPLQQIGGFPEDLHTLLDYEAWIRLAVRHRVLLSPRVVCSNRFHASMMTSRLLWPRTRAFEEDILVMHGRLADVLGAVPSEALRVRLLAKVLYPVVLLTRREQQAHYDRYLEDSGYPFARLMAEQEAEQDDFWRVKGWPRPLAKLGWRALRLATRARRRAMCRSEER